ncbi:hypothetical protein L3Q82_012665, partial [Scortum barcoo]
KCINKQWTGECVPITGGSHFSASPGKVYARVLERRIRPIVDPRIQEEQCGFRPGRGTLDQLYTLCRVLEGLWEFAQPVHMCFADVEKAFDRVPHRGILWGAPQSMGSEGAFAKGLFGLCTYDRSRSLVHMHCRQIWTRRSQGPEGVRFGNHRISSLLFPKEVFQACPTRRRPRGRPRTMSLSWPWERLGVPPEELEEVSGVREVWASLLSLLPPRPGPR